ncbi:putative flavonol 3-O-glucosyltransferase [Helianthus annuus]|nr:putative flavonol 3-O-glucosyltransferase [Helianthus annuus]KAJ0937920.1 putative flavonol 3-O-glucosyltransferase [Helianthus annuus]
MANTVAELVFIPAPGVGHIMSTIEMAKVLVNRDQRLSVSVLLINPPLPVPTLITYIESLAKNTIERIRFIKVPQDQTPPKLDLKAFLVSMYECINSHCKYIRNLLVDMINQPGSTRVVGFVVDVFCTGMIDVANEFNVPTYVFYTSNASLLGFNFYMETLCVDQDQKQDVIKLLSDSEGEMVVPSFVNPVPMKAFPADYQIQDGFDFLMCSFPELRKAKGIMVNTFLELETHAMKSFTDTNAPPVYPVGPVLNLDGIVGEIDNRDVNVISWLDGQPPLSVVVLCFGSSGSFNEVQVKEIALGLERSGHRFVWSLRLTPDLEQSFSDPRMVLPDGFLERTLGKGKVIGWAPQASLLAHEAVGGFVSHCGWNSILESLWFSVPTAAWPMYSEQQLNAFEMVVELGLAIDLKMDYKINFLNPDTNLVIVTAEEIETGIRRLMEDKEVRAKVKEMSKLSRATVAEGGSSYASIGYLLQEIMSNII